MEALIAGFKPINLLVLQAMHYNHIANLHEAPTHFF
jgi:hypothetical protein